MRFHQGELAVFWVGVWVWLNIAVNSIVTQRNWTGITGNIIIIPHDKST